MRQHYLLFLLLFCYCISVKSQKYWQQSVDYKMTVDVDVKTFKYNGQQTLVYTNNSPDTISKMFYHLFYNAFKPGSEMATRILSGKLTQGAKLKIIRGRTPEDEDNIVGHGKINSLRKINEQVKELKEGNECGIKYSGDMDIQVGDIVEAFIEEEKHRSIA